MNRIRMIKFLPIYFHIDGLMAEALQKSNFLKIAPGQTKWVMAEVIAYVSTYTTGCLQ